VRHAHARQCAISLTLDQALNLAVTDDGCGFLANHHAGVGLTSMRERAAELGGICVVQPAPGGGTQVLVKLPLPKEKDD
jgi:two-component system, NarL family, sensor kinase